MSEYFPIGVRLWVWERGRTGFDILAFEKSVVGESFDQIQAYADKNNGRLPFVVLDVDTPMTEALKAFKRFEAVVSVNRLDIREYQRA